MAARKPKPRRERTSYDATCYRCHGRIPKDKGRQDRYEDGRWLTAHINLKIYTARNEALADLVRAHHEKRVYQ